jgi:hypothetical protein
MIYFFWPLILVAVAIITILWIYRLIRLYRKRKDKRLSFWIQSIILTFILGYILWFLDLYPYAQTIQIRNRTENLTGEKFWCKKVLNFEDPSVRGEGYSLKVYRFSNETVKYFNNPDSTFFKDFPLYSDIKWKKTPIDSNEYKILDFVTMTYGHFSDEIIKYQNIVRKIVTTKDAFYSYSMGKSGNVNFYIIYPTDRLIILIYHNM